MQKYFSLLSQFGLTDKESALYLALLELGQADVTTIAKKSGVKRSTAYVILDTLTEKGFVSALSGTIRHFTAEDPQKLLAIEKTKVSQFEQALPGLLGLASHSTHKPGVRFFTGMEGIRTVYEESLLLPPGSEILSIGNAGIVQKSLPQFTQDYISRRVEGRISLRAITTSTPDSRVLLARDQHELRQTRLLSPEQLSEKVEINIYGNKVSAVSFVQNELIGVIMESAVFTTAHRQMFEILWKVAKDR